MLKIFLAVFSFLNKIKKEKTAKFSFSFKKNEKTFF